MISDGHRPVRWRLATGLLLLSCWLFSASGDSLAQGQRNPRDPKNFGKTPAPRREADRPADRPARPEPAPGPTNLLDSLQPAAERSADGLEPLPPPLDPTSPLLGSFFHEGAVREGGAWTLESSFRQADTTLEYTATLTVRSPGLYYWIPRTKGLYLVLLAERIFDGEGDYRYGASGLGTTLLTPTGLPVAAGASRNPTDAFGGEVRHPGNRILFAAADDLELLTDNETFRARFRYTIPVTEEFLPGWYRFTAQCGVQITNREFTTLMGANPAELALNASVDGLARYPLAAVHTVSPPVLPLSLFADLPTGGVLPTRAQGKLGLLTRRAGNGQHLLAPFTPDGGQQSYSFTLAIPFLQEGGQRGGTFPLALQPLDPASRLAITIETPDKTTLNLGEYRITGLRDGYLEFDRPAPNFAFSRFGRHLITVSGALTDATGQSYDLGGIYEIQVAMPLDLRVAMLPGTPGIARESCNLSTRVYPPVPAKLTITQWVAVQGSDRVFRWIQDGFCNDAGEFVPELTARRDGWVGNGQIYFEQEGEYRLLIEASWSAPDGRLWRGQWESANTVLAQGTATGEDGNTLGALGAFGGLGATRNPSLDQALDFPLLARELLFIPPGQHRFDPRLYGRGVPGLIEKRLLPASGLIDLTNGERGFVPASATPQGYPAAGYPEVRDRAGRLYAWAVSPGEEPRAVIRDGDGELPQALLGPELEWPAASAWTLFGGVSVWDARLREAAQGAYAGGLIVSDRVARFSVLPPGSDAQSLLPRPVPYVYQPAILPGAIVNQFAAFAPQCYIFPPQAGDLRITLRRPDNTEGYLTVPFDARGIASGRAVFEKLELPGVYTAAPQVTLGGTVHLPPSYQFYVPNRKSPFRMVLHEAPGAPVDWDRTLTLNGEITGDGFQQGTLFWTFTANGQVVAQSQQPIAVPTFSVPLDLSAATARVAGFDPDRSGHAGDITLFAIILNAKGELQTAHFRASLRHGRMEWVETGQSKRRGLFRNLF